MIKSMVSYLQRRKKHFGIDIGTDSVKVVEIEGRGERPLLKVLTSVPLPQGIYRDGEIGNRQALSDVIGELVMKSGISTPYCVSAIEGPNVFNRFINFPVMSRTEVLEAVKWDAEKYMPYSPEDCYLDAVILGNGTGAQEMKVLLVAAGKEMIDEHMETLLKADLLPIGIDFGALALGRALLDRNTQENSVILDIGDGSTKMTFFKGRAMAFSRTIPFGGNRITRILQEQLGLSRAEAENFKKHQQELLVPKVGETAETEQVRNHLSLALNDIKREINRSLEYYQLQNHDEALSRIIFAGGGSLLPGLQEALLMDLDLHHVTADLSKVVDYTPSFDQTFLQSASPVYSTALGLALWEEQS
jgi:type IV pilus assembly protein PilM